MGDPRTHMGVSWMSPKVYTFSSHSYTLKIIMWPWVITVVSLKLCSFSEMGMMTPDFQGWHNE